MQEELPTVIPWSSKTRNIQSKNVLSLVNVHQSKILTGNARK